MKLNFVLLFIIIVDYSYSCNIWKASDCPQAPSVEDEENMKSDLYTRDQLFAYCEQGKRYADCINERLHCCDLRSEHTGALAAFEVGLQRNAWRLGKYCAGLGESTIINYKCRTTTQPTQRTTTTTGSTTTAMPACEVEEAAKECNEILDERSKFESAWSVNEKMLWCKAAYNYIQCAGKHITNCSIMEVKDDVEQLSMFMDYIMKQANVNCQGGLYGCDTYTNDVRCKQSARKFYMGETFGGAIHLATSSIFNLILPILISSLLMIYR
ncbi:unnamed protein product [Didymodactylos carnosus]|uniref:Uncharacterized protein n=2 Tax=Didymodactylos carnosus TaxID=1234261 RepID=A0A814T4I9_9BILA|nr:unnamed protein product [Didymodactylos carnosus]CAF3919825.1 unnamed protein product [Didymodactylos carnosus]